MGTHQTSIEQWTSLKANSLAVVCLLVGIAGGWFIRGSQSSAGTSSGVAAGSSAPAKMVASAESPIPSPAHLKEMADAQAAPLLDRLKSDPNNPALLVSIGNLYYDAQQYPIAIDYYSRTLKARPADADVRTDMATAYWYMGNADAALAEFNKALTYAPNNPNTLFNRGLVKLQGKRDGAGAVADWEKLLAANPNYERKDKVKQMIAEAKSHRDVNP
jgi:cytochrome c-type biogenesis protein CcmH/NrfG